MTGAHAKVPQARYPVSFFVPCLVDAFHPGVAAGVVTVFKRLGIPLNCPPGQTCCGQPAYNSGYRRQARRAAQHFVRVFENANAVVCPSGSCVQMVRHHYRLLFADSPSWLARSRRLAERTFELSEYLVDILGVKALGARCTLRLTYLDSCHLLYGLGISRQPRQLIDHVRGTVRVEMRDSQRCCGFGGAFAVRYPEISSAMLADKLDNIAATGAEAVVGCDIGCLMHIAGMARRRGLALHVLHIAQLLAARGRGDLIHG